MKKVVHLKRALPLICNALNLQKFLNISVEVLPKKAKFQAKNCRNNTCAFSLVEMLMALLVASLLLAALAPVMTKKFSETVNFEGVVPNPGEPTKKVVYLTDPGDGEWDVPNGIRNFTITTVGAGGGGGAGSNYGCVVFTTTATPTGSLLGTDNEYCEHVRNDGNASFTLPDGVNEIYVSLVGGGGGGGAGSANLASKDWSTPGTYTWSVPQILKGDRTIVEMVGGGGGGGGADQGGGGGGASGGFVDHTFYNVASNKNEIKVIVGGGGKGGVYWNNPGAGGYNGGGAGAANTGGGGGGGASNFADGAITAFGGGGGAGQCLSGAGWHALGGAAWKIAYNNGGFSRTGGVCGPYDGKGGKSGGDGATGGGVVRGGWGATGQLGDDGRAMGAARGGQGGAAGLTENNYGNGGYGVDFDMYSGDANVGGGAGGGGGGSAWAPGTSAPTGCGVANGPRGVKIPKATMGAGGAGASCGWNANGTTDGGDGGDGKVIAWYLTHLYGGSAGRAGAVVPRSRVGLTSSMKGGHIITVNLGRGGTGGDRVIINSIGGGVVKSTKNTAGTVNNSTSLVNAHGNAGTASTIKFGTTTLASTGGGACGGGYQTTSSGVIGNGACIDYCGTRHIDGSCADVNWNWHGHQGGFEGSASAGGKSTPLVWDGDSGTSLGTGGTLTSRNGSNGLAGLGGAGAYYGGYGGKGGDGYVKIEWGLARNLDKSEAIRYSGGGGSAGEKITKKIVISPITRKIKYRIGAGGNGGSFNSNTLQMMDGSNGGDTSFGSGSEGFTAVVSKGGRGGKSVRINSTYDSYFMITSLVGNNGNGGIAECNVNNNCIESMNGIDGDHNKGGNGGQSGGVTPEGGNETSINGSDGVNFDGSSGGGNGGGGGISANRNYGKGGKGANGYIKIEYLD